MASSPITSLQIDGETMEIVTYFIFLGSKITVDGDCSNPNLKMLAPWKKSMIKPDSILKSIDITLPAKVHLVKSMDFPVVLYGCESWTVKKAEHLGRWKFSPPTEHSWKFSSVQSLSRVRLFVTP